MTDTLTPTISRTLPDALRVPLTAIRILLLAPLGPPADEIMRHLLADDVEVVDAPSVAAAEARLHGGAPAAIVLSAELERGTGYAALQTLRDRLVVSERCPAIAYGDHAGPLDRLRALQRGCVDFLALPVFYPELVARLQLAVSRNDSQQTLRVLPGGLQINHAARSVRVGDQAIVLTGMEYGLLKALAREPERVYEKRELLHDVWGYETVGRTRTLDAHACRLRSKLREAGGEYVQNVWGTGYRLLPDHVV
ncbi:MAG: response regulator transcription factor [Solirubrobacteraceae bacterium]|nr:response regulator transcription factor [Solirubrobacteraceae bacterium]